MILEADEGKEAWAIAQAWVKLARKGNMTAIKEILDRTEGRVTERVQLSSDIEKTNLILDRVVEALNKKIEEPKQLEGPRKKLNIKRVKKIRGYRKNEMEKLLNPSQLAEILNVRPGTIYSWLSRRIDIPYVKIAGTVRFREKAVQDWLFKKEQDRKRKNFED